MGSEERCEVACGTQLRWVGLALGREVGRWQSIAVAGNPLGKKQGDSSHSQP